MRKDGYNDGGPEPEKPTGRNYKLAVELLSELDCECEPSESTCDRCAALSDLHAAERESATRIETLERSVEEMRNGLRMALKFLEHPDVARVTEGFAMRGSVLCEHIRKYAYTGSERAP